MNDTAAPSAFAAALPGCRKPERTGRVRACRPLRGGVRKARSLLRASAVALLAGAALQLLFPARAAAASPARAAATTSFGRAAGALVPASASAALLVDGAAGAAGLRALLAAAAASAPTLRPDTLGKDLASSVSIDLLADGAAQPGLAPAGPRALVIAADAIGLSAPVADAAAANAALAAWLAQAGPTRMTRSSPLKGPLAAGTGARARAAMIAPVGGSLRLLAASGRGATALVAALAHVGPRKADTRHIALAPLVAEALDAAQAPVLWLRGAGPVQGAVLSLDASAKGLAGTGALVPAGAAEKDALFAGAAPAQACDGALLCVRGGIGPAAAPLLAAAAREVALREVPASGRELFERLLQRAVLAAAGPASLRVFRFDAAALKAARDPLEALSFLASAAVTPLSLEPPLPTPSSLAALPGGVVLQGPRSLCVQAQGPLALLAAPCPEAMPPPLAPGDDPALLFEARLDAAAVESALRRVSPLDALRADAAAVAYATHLMYGPLLARSGPVTLTARAVAGKPPAAALELRWPLAATR